MNKLHIYTICMILGYVIAVPVSESPQNQLRETNTNTEDSPGLNSGDEEKTHQQPREYTFETVETIDAAQTKDVLIVDEVDDDDMELAETHIFRPLFRYRAQLERRRRIDESRQ